ncbi:deleted in malignant brain tumors 1 protein-like [Grus americana]|uniref:deleted in malignant brain tumors 1 protein-like n=1 Tax=Grus americana TaxID=9117 RepID=UPI002407AB8B|nr:deleted in malignant brain tumors 1 protein-like [Grus americana]
MAATTILSWMVMITLGIQVDAAPGSSSFTPPESWTTGTGSCGGLLQGLSGTVQSPGYPSSYPNSARCVWRIQLWELDRRVELQFLDVELEGNSCQYDAIEVYDGGSPESLLLGTVCRNDHRIFKSSGHQMTILFRSDGSITQRGFRAYYSSFLSSGSTTDSGLTVPPPTAPGSSSFTPPESWTTGTSGGLEGSDCLLPPVMDHRMAGWLRLAGPSGGQLVLPPG